MATALSFEGPISLMKKWRSLGIGISTRGIEHVESRLWSTRIFRTATDLRDSAGGAEFGSCAKIQPSVASKAIRYLTIHICTDPLNRVYSSKMAAAKGALIRQSQAGAKAVTQLRKQAPYSPLTFY